MDFRQTLIDLRHSQKLTQEALSHLAGVSVGTIRRMEQGIDNTSTYVLSQVLKALGIKHSDFYRIVEEKGGGEASASTRM